MPVVSTRHCAACGGERMFEQPPCFDGHGALCPELACVDCGAAILIDPPVLRPGGGMPAEWSPTLPARAA